MGKIIKGLIEYNGIDNCAYKELVHFKQFNINQIISTTCEKPDISQITKVWLSHCIVNTELVKTPKGKSCEGQILTGNKVLISADLEIKIEYISCSLNQSLHSINSTIPICSYITLGKDLNLYSSIFANIVIEDIYCEQLDNKNVYTDATLMAVADIC